MMSIESSSVIFVTAKQEINYATRTGRASGHGHPTKLQSFQIDNVEEELTRRRRQGRSYPRAWLYADCSQCEQFDRGGHIMKKYYLEIVDVVPMRTSTSGKISGRPKTTLMVMETKAPEQDRHVTTPYRTAWKCWAEAQ